ncbi:MFS transporter [Maridesulfovibrio salexigens]|uniref:Major facilitator superfamily MFS_1 n=1 Tax=Maridesulfovibrio salexigens (strain ATCC 14822 / DSM 2638 / NCIMB 8403 / VKM B-1763) TaxID=526222 RepID=C6BX39_MARSD|nr:MFS transporter [Maridesulfovibrio salexigens]ACS78519.1 major facilitator superfamily MFS_1 [Maridesulfovibrio salexigens DSM 2638]
MSVSNNEMIKKPSIQFKLFLLACMYLCQAIPLGYVFGCLPVILREQGVNLKAVGAVFALHLPWALKFLCASWVDSKYIPALGRRKSWIFPMQWIGAALLVGISYFSPDQNFSLMYLLLFLLSCVMATNDIAVDGYATDILEESERPWGNSIQSAARFAGLMLGGGVMLFMNSNFGWQTLCMFLSAVVFSFSLPVLFHREIDPLIHSVADGECSREGVWAFIKRPEVLRVLPVLIAPTAFAFTSVQMRTPLLVDMGFDSRSVGTILMHYAYPAGLAGTFLSGWFLHRVGGRAFLRGFCSTVILLAACTVFMARSGPIPYWQAALLLSVDNILIGAVMVWSFTLMMKVSAGSNAGTGFAVLSSLFIIVPMAAAPIFGHIGDLLGMEGLYILLGLLCFAGFMVAEISGRHERSPGAARMVGSSG